MSCSYVKLQKKISLLFAKCRAILNDKNKKNNNDNDNNNIIGNYRTTKVRRNSIVLRRTTLAIIHGDIHSKSK